MVRPAAAGLEISHATVNGKFPPRSASTSRRSKRGRGRMTNPRRFRSSSTKHEVRAVLFDTFGTVVNWRGRRRRCESRASANGTALMSMPRLADVWRARYQPSMEEVRSRQRGFVPLDHLHRENLEATLREFGVRLPAEAMDDLN